MKTLFVKEFLRFLRAPVQTFLPSLVLTLMYLVVFGSSVSSHAHQVEGSPFLHFILPGLVFLGVVNNAFLNSATSLFMTRLQGSLVDLLVAPMGPGELMAGFIGSSMVRGLLAGTLIWAMGALFTGLHMAHTGAVVFFLFLSAYVFGVLGMLAAVWAEKFDQLNAIPALILLPLIFLGGVFYSIRELPPPWGTVSLLNPMVYMVEGLRYGMLGRSLFPPLLGGGILAGCAVAATAAVYLVLRSGYRLRT